MSFFKMPFKDKRSQELFSRDEIKSVIGRRQSDRTRLALIIKAPKTAFETAFNIFYYLSVVISDIV